MILGLGVGLSRNTGGGGGGGFISPVVNYAAQGNLLFHCRPRDASTISESSNAITEVRDYNGSGRKWVPYSGVDAPTYGTRTQFGRNVIDFNGASQRLDGLSQASGLENIVNGQHTIYVVATYDSIGSNDVVIGGEAAGGPDRMYIGNFRVLPRTTAQMVGDANTDTYPHVVVSARGASESRAYQDTLEFSDSPKTNASNSVLGLLTIGGREAGAASDTFNGYIEDILIYEGLHTDEVRNRIIESLAFECNIPLPTWDYDVFLAAGQSNDGGQSQQAIEAEDQPYNPYIVQIGRDASYDKKTIAGVQELNHFSGASGPGFPFKFAQLYAATNPNKKILIVPSAAANTGFASNDWNKGNARYEDAIDRVNTAMAYGTGTKTFKGILWHQGENDSSLSEAAYAAALDQMISDMRTDITGATSSTPFVLGQLVPNFSGAAGVKAAILDTPNRVANTAVVLNTDLTDRGDNIHYDRASLRILGQRYYDAFLTLI